MEWERLLSPTRFSQDNGRVERFESRTDNGRPDLARSDYDVDIDRVTFSRSFRRLGRKTQVHPFVEDDDIHNRLTHSVEVARVGRSLGALVGEALKREGELPDSISPANLADVVQVACLAHDLGNPPFGHTGEDAIRAWFADPANNIYLTPLSVEQQFDALTYEGNAHSLRIVASLEMYKGKGGMRLTAAALGALMKYPWVSSYDPKRRAVGSKPTPKFCVYQSELPLARAVAKELDLPPKLEAEGGPIAWARHPLSYLMEAADDICYALLDLEDAVQMGLIDEDEMGEALRDLVDSSGWADAPVAEKCSRLRGQAVGAAIDAVAATFLRHRREILDGTFPHKDLIAADMDGEFAGRCRALEKAKALARDKIYSHPRKLMLTVAAYPCLGSILSVLIGSAHGYVENKGDLSKMKAPERAAAKLLDGVLDRGDSHYAAYMKTLDYVCSLTDNSAAKLAREFSGIWMGA